MMVVNKDHAAYMRRYRTDPIHAARHRESSRRWREGNREAHRAYQRQWKTDHPGYAMERYHADPEAHHARVIRYRYGDDYQRFWDQQRGVCAICRQPERTPIRHGDGVRRLSMDHDHETHEARGLLCTSCNVSLGYYERGCQRTKFHQLGLLSNVERYLSGIEWW